MTSIFEFMTDENESTHWKNWFIYDNGMVLLETGIDNDIDGVSIFDWEDVPQRVKEKLKFRKPC